MIVELLVNLITGIIKLLATPFSILPDTPVALRTAVNGYMDLVFNNLNFIGFFVNINTLKAVAPLAIAIWTLNKTYTFLLWIIRKIPFSIE